MVWCAIKKFDTFYELAIIFSIVIPIALCDILLFVFIGLYNKYKIKQFLNIKEHGSCYKGTILTAHHKPKPARHSLLIKDTGEISVDVNNKIYNITDIDYNNEFKNLENSLKKLKKNFDINAKKFDDYIHNRINTIDKDFNLSKNTQMEITIYVLNDKAVANLNSITIK